MWRLSTPAEVPSYSFRPSLLGAPRNLKLLAGGVAWEAGDKSGEISYRAVRRMRLSFRPISMQSQRFMAELWAEGAPKLTIVSSSWKSMVEQVRQDRPYRDFIVELHRRVAAAGATVSYTRGTSPLTYWPGLAVFAAVSLASAALLVRALQAHALGGAAFVGGFLALFLWQAGNFFRRNRPGHYAPAALPAELLPKA